MHKLLTISIAMCTFNGEKYLQEQLDSFLQQTRLPDELVVCDDGSRDGTVIILEGFVAQAPFPVRLFINPQNLGFNKNFEKAISLCHGEIISISDQDDYWLPKKLATIEQKFLENPKIGSVVHDATLVDEKLKPLGYSLWHSIKFAGPMQNSFIDNEIKVFLKSPFVWGATVSFRSNLVDFFLPIPSYWNYDEWIGLISVILTKTCIISKELNLYRQHAAQFSRSKRLGIFDLVFNKTKGPNEKSFKMQEIKWRMALLCLSIDFFPFLESNILSLIQAKVFHFKARSELPRSKLLRVPHVVNETISGRYHQYSGGWKSILKDMVIY